MENYERLPNYLQEQLTALEVPYDCTILEREFRARRLLPDIDETHTLAEGWYVAGDVSSTLSELSQGGRMGQQVSGVFLGNDGKLHRYDQEYQIGIGDPPLKVPPAQLVLKYLWNGIHDVIPRGTMKVLESTDDLWDYRPHLIRRAERHGISTEDF